jgi:hypothetical protein
VRARVFRKLSTASSVNVILNRKNELLTVNAVGKVKGIIGEQAASQLFGHVRGFPVFGRKARLPPGVIVASNSAEA